MRLKSNWLGNVICSLYILLVLFSACESKKVKLDEKQFSSLLLEIHKIDAALNVSSDLRSQGQKKNYAYYNAVFDKYGITNAEFDSCMHYYSSRTEEFNDIYDVIIDSLNRELTVKDTILARLRCNDSINYYQGADTLVLQDVKGTLLFEVDSISAGEYHFVSMVKLDTVQSNKNIQIESWFLTDLNDTLKIRRIRMMQDTVKHQYQWKQYVDSTYKRLEIHLVKEKIVRNPKDKKVKTVKKEILEGVMYDIALYRPYLPENTEKRLQRGLKSQHVYKSSKPTK